MLNDKRTTYFVSDFLTRHCKWLLVSPDFWDLVTRWNGGNESICNIRTLVCCSHS